MENKSEILLDSGTNEVEFLEFMLGATSFGINVLKVREIIKPVNITKIPHSHYNVEGIVELRGEVLAVINLRKALNIDGLSQYSEQKFIVSEFNGMKVILRVDHVTQIHRLSWSDMEKPTSVQQGFEDHITGVIKLESKLILLVDVEKILFDLYPGLDKESIRISNDKNPARREKRIMIAEDSSMLRRLLGETLHAAGYEQIFFFENGKEAWEYMVGVVRNGKERIDLLITDIEMPQMDGHHLTKRIKEDSSLSEIPVIIFSSLITEHLKHKGEQVGADAQISKPQLTKLIDLMDSHLLKT
ncbi:chemotaxis protein [Sutcliffiella horikoshii]|uniref:chemotaxis protein n=1 Tax=Sutcliffiella horikoshii TaxID=79883 RepID=UPI0022AB32B7|nr:chemotaxis protein [Sutcliffiella horikoshii]MCG1020438.1 chemotaxis signal transduction protein CheV [Sutcliffiella horikoshii]